MIMQCCIILKLRRQIYYNALLYYGLSQNTIDRFVHNLSIATRKKIIECCKILGVTETTTRDELKDVFLKLVKKYHPDSGSCVANAGKFAEIQAAYRYIRENMFNLKLDDMENELLDKDFGIKHTVPQHRHFLTSEGVGYGTPSQRQKQYDQHKITRAAERVYNYRSKKIASQNENLLLVKDAALARQFKTSQAVERLVEDLIQESMSRGEFNNLPGTGKPLKYAPENPYVDSMTHKLNQILINNGFTPEWIVLDREIQSERNELCAFLQNQRSQLSQIPLNAKENVKWNDIITQAKKKAKALNMKIDKFNMVVPVLNKQKLHFQVNAEAEKILQNGRTKYDKHLPHTGQTTGETTSNQNYTEENLFSFIWNWFR